MAAAQYECLELYELNDQLNALLASAGGSLNAKQKDQVAAILIAASLANINGVKQECFNKAASQAATVDLDGRTRTIPSKRLDILQGWFTQTALLGETNKSIIDQVIYEVKKVNTIAFPSVAVCATPRKGGKKKHQKGGYFTDNSKKLIASALAASIIGGTVFTAQYIGISATISRVASYVVDFFGTRSLIDASACNTTLGYYANRGATWFGAQSCRAIRMHNSAEIANIVGRVQTWTTVIKTFLGAGGALSLGGLYTYLLNHVVDPLDRWIDSRHQCQSLSARQELVITAIAMLNGKEQGDAFIEELEGGEAIQKTSGYMSAAFLNIPLSQENVIAYTGGGKLIKEDGSEEDIASAAIPSTAIVKILKGGEMKPYGAYDLSKEDFQRYLSCYKDTRKILASAAPPSPTAAAAPSSAEEETEAPASSMEIERDEDNDVVMSVTGGGAKKRKQKKKKTIKKKTMKKKQKKRGRKTGKKHHAKGNKKRGSKTGKKHNKKGNKKRSSKTRKR